MDLKLKNKRALVTGSTAGIGYSIASQLLKEGAAVYINGRTQKRVDEAVQSLSSVGKVSGVAADFSKTEEINRFRFPA